MLKYLVSRVGTIVSFPKWDAISRNVLVVAKNRAFLCCLERRNERRRLYLDTFDKKRIQNIRYLVTTKNYLILTIDIEKGNFLSLCWEISLSIFDFLFLLIKSSSKTWCSVRGVFFYRTSLLIAVCTSGPLSSFGIFFQKKKSIKWKRDELWRA